MLVDALQGYYGLPILIAFASLVAVVYRAYDASNFSSRIPRIREKIGQKSFRLWTRFAFYFDCRNLYGDVWHKFSKHGTAVLVPTLGARNEIFLPHTSMKWVLSQPAKVLGMWEAFSEMFQLHHSLGDDKFMLDTWPHLLSRHVLTQELDDHLMAIHEEVQVAMDTHLGMDTEDWTTLDLLDTVRKVITQTGSRFTVGMPLCRNQDYLETIMDTVDSIVANAGATGFFPESIRHWLGRIICYPTHRKIARLSTWYVEEFKRRIQDLEDGSPDQKVDLLQKMLRFASKHRREELATEQMTRRMCMSNLAFIYLASFTTTNILTNIMASDKTHSTIGKLRQEAEEFMTRYPDPKELWQRKNTDLMHHTDSVLRETLRLNTVPTRSVVRKVMVDGVVSDTGIPLPKGSLVGFVAHPMHTDPDRWEKPDSFDPFRFVRLREDQEEGARAKADSADVGGDWNPHSFLSTASLLVFGRGKNACPGRFLMDFQLKMVISYLVTHYDLKFPEEYGDQRPANKWVLEFIFPAGGVKFQVKRRKNINTSST